MLVCMCRCRLLIVRNTGWTKDVVVPEMEAESNRRMQFRALLNKRQSISSVQYKRGKKQDNRCRSVR
jgi:hypothetical protein